jgi:hypothetical protein
MGKRILDIPSSGGRALYPTPPYSSALALELVTKPPEALGHAGGRSNNVLRTQSLGEMVSRPDIHRIRKVIHVQIRPNVWVMQAVDQTAT